MLIYMAAAATPLRIGTAIDWDAVTAVSTVVLAVVTFLMVIATVWMAWNTGRALKQNNDLRSDANLHYKQTREQDQQHHEDEFRPVLILVPKEGVGAAARRHLIDVQPQTIPSQVFVQCPIQNIGVGLALNVHMFVRKDERTGFGPNIELTPIASGGELVPGHGRFALPVVNNNFRDADLNGLPGGAWVIVLEYEDIFGNRFHTLHVKNPLLPWARTGRGPAPDTTPKEPG